MNTVQQSRPHGNDQWHGDQRNDCGCKNCLQVTSAEPVLQEDCLRGTDHEVAHAEHKHPNHELSVAMIFHQDAPIGVQRVACHCRRVHRIRTDSASSRFRAFTPSESSGASQSHASEDGVSVQANESKHRECDMETLCTEVHRCTNDPPCKCQHDGLHARHLASNTCASFLRVILPPHCGAHGDDASPCRSCNQHQETRAQESPRIERHSGDERHADTCTDLDSRNESNLVATAAHSRPHKACEICKVRCCTHECHREVKKFRRYARDSRPCFLDKHGHSAAFNRSEHDGKECPRKQFARIVRALHGWKRARVESPEPVGEEFDERAWVCGVLHVVRVDERSPTPSGAGGREARTPSVGGFACRRSRPSTRGRHGHRRSDWVAIPWGSHRFEQIGVEPAPEGVGPRQSKVSLARQ